MLNRRRGVLLGALAVFLVLGVVAMSLSNGSDFGLWQTIGFATLTRRESPNDSLACLPETCPQARADISPPLFTVSATRLAEKLRTALRNEPRVTELAPVNDLHLRFVQRSALMLYPDLVDVLIVPRSSGAATLAIYSRSAVGRSDLGVNRARIERWLSYIGL